MPASRCSALGRWLVAGLSILATHRALSAQARLQHVDWYGLRTVDAEEAAEALGFGPGAPADVDRKAAEARLRALPGIEDARILLMLMPGREIALVGVREVGAVEPGCREAPTGEATIPAEFVESYHAMLTAGMEGMRKGRGGEDRSQGHSLSRYEPAREHQLRAREMVDEHVEELRRALRESANPERRFVATWAIAYASDKAAVVPDLAYAMRDPDDTVRNNAVRALSVMADWAAKRDDFAVDIDCTPLLEMLESFTWTDRNKSAALLAALAPGDEALLRRLQEQSLPALEEMARWHSLGHALFSIRILAAIAGQDPDTVGEDLLGTRKEDARRERLETLIAAARARTWDD